MLSKDELLAKAQLLRDGTPAMGNSLREKARIAYRRDLLENLIKILETSPLELSDALAQFLTTNWHFVGQSCLAYTAQPTADLTNFLCEIASWVAEEKNKTLNKKEDGSTEQRPYHALSLLMPSIQIDSIRDQYLNLGPELNEQGRWTNPQLDLQEVLKTHIISDNQQYLIPVALLTELESSFNPKALQNPYYNYQCHEASSAYLSEGEYLRLANHSKDSSEFIDALSRYETLCQDSSTLLGHLRQLSNFLYINSSHGGIGASENAANGVYAAIFDFNRYYQSLGSSIQNLIPPEVKNELETLLSLSSEPSLNINATANLQTCIGTRREELDRAIRNHEATLSALSLDGETKEDLIKDAKSRLELCRNFLQVQLKEKNYCSGFEKRGLNREVLQRLKVQIEVQSINDAYELMQLEPSEISDLCDSEQVQEQLVQQFQSIDELVIFFHEAHPRKLRAMLRLIAPLVTKNFLTSPIELSALFISLDAQRVQIICEVLKEKNLLDSLITDGLALANTLQLLSPEQRTIIFTIQQERLNPLIPNAHTFRALLCFLSSEQREIVFASQSERLSQLIDNAQDFNALLLYLSPEQRNLVFEKEKTRLDSFIKQAPDLIHVIQHLSPEQQEQILNAQKKRFMQLIGKPTFFAALMELLIPQHREIIFEEHKDRLVELIKTAEDFQAILEPLSPQQREIIFKAVSPKLQALLQNGTDFYLISKHLSQERRNGLFAAIQTRITELVKNAHDFKCLIESLPPEKRPIIFMAIKNALPNLIHNAADFYAVQSHLTVEQKAFIFEAVQYQLPSLIRNSVDYERVFKYLSPEQSAIIFAQIQETLPKIIKDAEEFNIAMSLISPTQRAALFKRMSQDLPQFIKNNTSFRAIFEFLSPEQAMMIFEQVSGKIPAFINNANNFAAILEFLPPEERSLVFENLKAKLIPTIRTSQDLAAMLCFLSEKQRTITLEDLKQKLPKLFTDYSDFIAALKFCSPKQRAILMSALKNQLAGMIKNLAEFEALFQYLTEEQCTHVLAAKKDKLAKMIKTSAQFVRVLKLLSPQQRTIVLSTVIQQRGLAKVLKSPADLRVILPHLAPQEMASILEALRARLAQMLSPLDSSLKSLEAVLAEEQKKLFIQYYFKSLLIELRAQKSKLLAQETQAHIDSLSSILDTEMSSFIARGNYKLISENNFKKNCFNALNQTQSLLQKAEFSLLAPLFEKLAQLLPLVSNFIPLKEKRPRAELERNPSSFTEEKRRRLAPQQIEQTQGEKRERPEWKPKQQPEQQAKRPKTAPSFFNRGSAEGDASNTSWDLNFKDS